MPAYSKEDQRLLNQELQARLKEEGYFDLADKDGEVWKPIEGYGNHYMVSNIGRVKALPCVVMRSDGKPHPMKEMICIPFMNHWGYLSVTFVLAEDIRQEVTSGENY